MTFAEFFKQKRIASRQTLRAFCRQHNFDPGNISKLERSRISAPQKTETLDRYMVALELDEAERREFVALAAISAGKIPEPLTEEEFVKMLPVIFEMAGASEEDLRKFVDWFRERV